jgi:antitoxin component YwqK of YwqJK toxin-antitoxin module
MKKMIPIKRLFFVFTFFACFFMDATIIAQKINQFDENKQRTGVWQKKYANNKIRYSGAFENGKEVGVFKFYDISSSQFPAIIKTYSSESSSVLVEFYTIKGKLQSKGYFINKDRIGAWIYYFKDGKKMSEEFYKEGKLEGKLVNYYPNGKATEISFYKNGLIDGISQKYSSKGILIEEVTFKNGTLNGVAKYFELNGDLKETGSYLEGRRTGKWEYYLDGEVAPDENLKKKKSTFTRKN